MLRQDKNKNSYIRPKILAPVKDLHSAEVVLKNGADILYGGIKGWSLRPNMFEMTKVEFLELIRLAKSYQKEVLLSMNCFYRSTEILSALKLIEQMANSGIAGVIVSELGLVRDVKRKFPDLSVHVSVQTSASNIKELEFYKTIGVDNVTLPRNLIEVSAENVKRLAKTGIRITVFLVGDDSSNYDGHCFLSSYLNQKMIKDDTDREFCAIGSANRNGYCFLMCKRICEYIEKGKSYGMAFYLRKQDLALFIKIRELVEAGVSIFKVQGREFPTPLVGRFIRNIRNLLDNLDDEIRYQKLTAKIHKLVKLKLQIQANHLWLLLKSRSMFWLKFRRYIENPWDDLESFLWFYMPFYSSLKWKRFQKENLAKDGDFLKGAP